MGKDKKDKQRSRQNYKQRSRQNYKQKKMRIKNGKEKS